jgi:hypothetical protein
MPGRIAEVRDQGSGARLQVSDFFFLTDLFFFFLTPDP